jgi:hypothetical protein
MTIVKKYQNRIMINDGKTTKIIDLTPINKLKAKLEERVIQRKDWKDRSCIQAISEIQEGYDNLNEDQKPYFMSYLLSRITGLSDLYLSIIENPSSFVEWVDFLDKYKDLKQFPSR